MNKLVFCLVVCFAVSFFSVGAEQLYRRAARGPPQRPTQRATQRSPQRSLQRSSQRPSKRPSQRLSQRSFQKGRARTPANITNQITTRRPFRRTNTVDFARRLQRSQWARRIYSKRSQWRRGTPRRPSSLRGRYQRDTKFRQYRRRTHQRRSRDGVQQRNTWNQRRGSHQRRLADFRREGNDQGENRSQQLEEQGENSPQQMETPSAVPTKRHGRKPAQSINEEPSAINEEPSAITLPESFDCGEAYSNGRSLGSKRCVRINGEPVETSIAQALMTMQDAASQEGVNIQVVSGFRSMSEQEYFYNCYVTKSCNNGNLAARPGYSNHQNGIALDLNTSSRGVYDWLSQNGSKYGFIRTVPSETWHWEYLPNQRCNSVVTYNCN